MIFFHYSDDELMDIKEVLNEYCNMQLDIDLKKRFGYEECFIQSILYKINNQFDHRYFKHI